MNSLFDNKGHQKILSVESNYQTEVISAKGFSTREKIISEMCYDK